MSNRQKTSHLRLIDGSVGRGAQGAGAGVGGAAGARATQRSEPELDGSELGRQELGRQELGRQELGRQELGREELGREELGRENAQPSDAEADAVPLSRRGAKAPYRPLLELEDAQLVSLALAGQAGAFEALYRRHVTFAINLATRIEGSSRDVEDVVHDAFIKAMNRLTDLSDPAAFRSWLGSIVVYAVRSRLRRHRLMAVLGLARGADPIELDSLTSSQASPLVRAQLAQVYALLRTRPVDDRIAWTLRHIEGHELDSVAKLCGCSLATVKRRITRAQQFLEEHFVSTEAGSDDEPLAPNALPTDSPAPAHQNSHGHQPGSSKSGSTKTAQS